jgi:pyrroloquinoline quinone biosynthesis protein D
LSVPLDARPRLHPKARLRADALSGRTMLLYPERGLRLNATGEEVVRLCTGQATVAEIAATLATRHASDGATVLAEVRAFLDSLAERGLLGGLEGEAGP